MPDDRVRVTLPGPGEPNGLALMLAQYCEQNLAEFPHKGRQARRLRGKLAISAAEGDIGVTLHFTGEEIVISNGCAPDAALQVRGGIMALSQLAGGGTGALRQYARRELRVRFPWRHPAFAIRTARFLALPAELRRADAPAVGAWAWILAAGALLAVAGGAAYILWG